MWGAAHRLMQEEDGGEPTNLHDAGSKTTYFQAAQALARQYYAGTPIQNISAQSIGTTYWENKFPTAAGQAVNQLFGTSSEAPGTTQPCLGSPFANSANVSATQAMYDLFCNFSGNETTALELADAPGLITSTCFPACATINGALTNGYDYYSPQFFFHADAVEEYREQRLQRTGGTIQSAPQVGRAGNSDLNYTYSKSIDVGFRMLNA